MNKYHIMVYRVYRRASGCAAGLFFYKQKNIITYKQKEMKTGDVVQITVKTMYGDISVGFTIIDVVDEHDKMFFLYAQGRACKGQLLVNGKWKLSESVDLLDLRIPA